MKKVLLFLSVSIGITFSACAQQQSAPLAEQPLGFEEYDPISTLKVEEHPLKKAKFPFIDVHNHQYQMPTQDLKALVKEMDELNMGIMVNLSGRGWSQEWAEGTATLKGSLENLQKPWFCRY
jgi:hypothetical protein